MVLSQGDQVTGLMTKRKEVSRKMERSFQIRGEHDQEGPTTGSPNQNTRWTR